MSLDLALMRGQRAAERLMVDACVIRRVTGQSRDDESGTVTDTLIDVYAGKCRVQQRQETSASPVNSGEDYVLLLSVELQLPLAVVGLEVSDQVEITQSRDADLPGRRFLIRSLAHKTHATARRVQCTERTG